MKDMKNRSFRFDAVEIDVQNLWVTVRSAIRPLEPKSFRLLLFLAENPGGVLPKAEIKGVDCTSNVSGRSEIYVTPF